MKILFFAVSDMLQEQIVTGLGSLDEHDVSVVFYDRLSIPPDREMLNAAHRIAPDVIVYTGRHGGTHLAARHTFQVMRRIAPVVMILHDGSEALWQPMLEAYRFDDVFDAIVNIDGNPDWPKGPKDLTLLTPIDPRFYTRAA